MEDFLVLQFNNIDLISANDILRKFSIVNCLVVSDSLRPRGLQPTGLLHPWDFPGKNTGVGCHFLLQCMKVKSESEVAQLCLTLSDPMDCSLPGSSIHGIFQARVLEWGAIAFSDVEEQKCLYTTIVQKLVQPVWRTILQYLRKLTVHVSYDEETCKM